MMRRLFYSLVLSGCLLGGGGVAAQVDSVTPVVAAADSAVVPLAEGDSVTGSIEELIGDEDMAALQEMQQQGLGVGLHEQLKSKFVEGSASFMSLVALALVLGLAFCIERIIYLTLSEINAKRLLRDIGQRMAEDDVEGAKALCRDTRGPVASICLQGLDHADEPMEAVERSIMGCGAVQTAKMEKGCSWIKLFIAVAPSLGFLGTVIGMVMAFDQIQEAGDISPTIVASGMKVALITTIFGIIVAIILQVFYNYIRSKIEHLTSQMEESAIALIDLLQRRQLRKSDNV